MIYHAGKVATISLANPVDIDEKHFWTLSPKSSNSIFFQARKQ